MSYTQDWSRRHRENMPESAAPYPFDIEAGIAQHNPRWTRDSQTSYWAHGAPLGNGDFGAIVYGPPRT